MVTLRFQRGNILRKLLYAHCHAQEFRAAGLQYLSWPEIKEMKDTFQFASHTDNLHELSWNGKGKLTTVSEGELTEDVARSVKKLQGTQYFSYS